MARPKLPPTLPDPREKRADTSPRMIGGFDAGPVYVKPAKREPWWQREAKRVGAERDV